MAGKVSRFAIFVVYLKLYDLEHIDGHKYKWYQTVVHDKLGKWLAECADKREAMTIGDVTRYMKSHRKSGKDRTHDKKTGKINPVEIFRIKKKVGNPQVLTETAGNHGEQHHPTQNQYMVALKIVQKKLNRKGIHKLRKPKIKSSHRENYFNL
jgi:hypothetical protein